MRLSCTWDFTHHHFVVCLLTFFAYAFFHISRKTLSTVKSTAILNWQPQAFPNGTVFDPDIYDPHVWTENQFCNLEADCEYYAGVLDLVFTISYAVGLYLFGYLGDRYDPRVVLSVGMWSSAVLLFLFGFLPELFRLYNLNGFIGYYVFVYILFGLVQGTGWPTVMCLMGSWIGKSSRGALLGLWSASAQVGNIIGSYLSSAVLPYGYEFTFLVNASVILAGGVVVMAGVITHPKFVGLREPVEKSVESDIQHLSDTRKPVGFIRALMLPGVPTCSLSYFCLKMVDYSFFFWLPYYLQNKFSWTNTDADQLSTWYDWGGLIGGFLGGVVTDRIGYRSPVVSLMLLISIGSLLGYSNSPNDRTINAVLMGIVGFFVSGSANLISGAITADLGRQPKIRANSAALSTVTGIVDGTGTVGAALGQILLPLIENNFNWLAVFYLFMVMATLTLFCMIPMTLRETREIANRLISWRNSRRNSVEESNKY